MQHHVRAPDGMIHCYKCGKNLPADRMHFHKNSSHPSGFATPCKSCKGIKRQNIIRIGNMPEGMDECCKCRKLFPLNSDNFYRNKSNKTGFVSTCKTCSKLASRKIPLGISDYYCCSRCRKTKKQNEFPEKNRLKRIGRYCSTCEEQIHIKENAPEGKKYCLNCKKYVLISMFSSVKARNCFSCKKIKKRNTYLKTNKRYYGRGNVSGCYKRVCTG